MKKSIIIVFAILVLTGCSKTITCKNSGNEINIKYNGEEIKDINYVATFDNEELAESMCPIMEYTLKEGSTIDCDGNTVKVKDYQYSIDVEDLTKDNVVNYFESQNYTCE